MGTNLMSAASFWFYLKGWYPLAGIMVGISALAKLVVHALLALGDLGRWYKEMGVAPINVAVAEQYEALMRGTLDATIYPIYTIDASKCTDCASCAGVCPTAACVPAIPMAFTVWEESRWRRFAQPAAAPKCPKVPVACQPQR
jgi:NAD-dependent dihydropyrimidine dehydrogenase PreA subunit